jgi:hypothetical protein
MQIITATSDTAPSGAPEEIPQQCLLG